MVDGFYEWYDVVNGFYEWYDVVDGKGYGSVDQAWSGRHVYPSCQYLHEFFYE